MNISAGERQYIATSTVKGCRLDGRSAEAFRRVAAQLDVVPQATGSARVRLGKTDVFVGIKVELGQPTSDAPDCGRIEFFVDYAPCGTPDVEVIDHNRSMDSTVTSSTRRTLRRSTAMNWAMHCHIYGRWIGKRKRVRRGCEGLQDTRIVAGCGLDMRQLGILDDKTCFVIFVDATVLNVDGNVLGAISIATRCALHGLSLPRVEVRRHRDGSDGRKREAVGGA